MPFRGGVSVHVLEATEEEEVETAECPECGEPMAEGAVLCVACGYHASLGRKIDTDFE